MKVGIAQLTEARGQLCTLFEHFFVNALASGVNHTIEIDHGANLETIEVSSAHRKLQTDCFSLFSAIGHSTVSRRM